MAQARGEITAMIGPQLQHAAAMAYSLVEALPGRVGRDGEVGMGPYQVPGMPQLLKLLVEVWQRCTQHPNPSPNTWRYTWPGEAPEARTRDGSTTAASSGVMIPFGNDTSSG